MDLINALLKKGVKLQVFDPEAMANVKRIYGDKLTYANSMYEAVEASDALLICTEWSIFRTPDTDRLKKLMKAPAIFDGRNLYDVDEMEKEGFTYVSIGRREIK